MDSTYRPQSPDLSSYAPQSPDLSGLQPPIPDIPGQLPSSRYGHHHSRSQDRFGGSYGHNTYGYGYSPTSIPVQPQYSQSHSQQYSMPQSQPFDDDEYLPDAPSSKRQRRAHHQQLPTLVSNGSSFDPNQHSQLTAPLTKMSTSTSDPTLGVTLKTSFPVARIKRIMQADEDVGKVAQVTPHVVSRALELFMIKLISASAQQARAGMAPSQTAASQSQSQSGGKGQKRVLAQHLKKAIQADDKFDFLADIVAKIPDAPTKAKKEAPSDSDEEGASSAKPKAGRKKGGGAGKKRKESGDDF